MSYEQFIFTLKILAVVIGFVAFYVYVHVFNSTDSAYNHLNKIMYSIDCSAKFVKLLIYTTLFGPLIAIASWVSFNAPMWSHIQKSLPPEKITKEETE